MATPRHAPLADEAELGALLSALADGELSERECTHLMQHLASLDERAELGAPLAQWEQFQIVGECLRAPGEHHAAVDSAAFLHKFRTRLQREELRYPVYHSAPVAASSPTPLEVDVGQHGEAANASVFRWKMAAGFASLAAAAAIGWNSMATFGGPESGLPLQLASSENAPATSAQPQVLDAGTSLAAAPASAGSGGGGIVTVAEQRGPNWPVASGNAAAHGPLRPQENVLIRDPKLDELLQRHYANTLTLQPPAAFLRNATMNGGSVGQ